MRCAHTLFHKHVIHKRKEEGKKEEKERRLGEETKKEKKNILELSVYNMTALKGRLIAMDI